MKSTGIVRKIDSLGRIVLPLSCAGAWTWATRIRWRSMWTVTPLC